MSHCPMPKGLNDWPGELQMSIADSLFNNSSEGICITDETEHIVEVNPTLCSLTGYSKQELLGNTPRIFCSGLQNHEFYAEMWAALKNTGQWSGELWNRNKSGALYACRLNIAAICNDAGSVTHYLCIQSDITAAKVYQERLEKNANYDDLTELPNRALLTDRLHQAMAQAQRTGLMLAICYLDLDGFKAINDTFGHEIGDHALIEVATRLTRSVRIGDTVARVGGDEFVILLWGIKDRGECDQTLSRIVADVGSIKTLGQCQVAMTASIGVTLYPEDGDDIALLSAQADSAMYRSKVSGGGAWRYFKT